MNADPFDFMGSGRGTDRPGEWRPRRRARSGPDLADDRHSVVACVQLLKELNARTIPPVADVVLNIASRHGLDCDTVWPSVFILRYDTPEVVAFLVQSMSSSISNAPMFELFVKFDGLVSAGAGAVPDPNAGGERCHCKH